jgi:Oxidoreductase family, NAD-binding Rossmann fold
MKIQPVKTAIVGCGAISDAYLTTMINKFTILDVVGCCDRNSEKAQATAQKYGIKVLSMEEILADTSIEIVVNLTTPAVHYPVSKQLLEAGKHVYTEKVLSVELEHAAELVKISDQKKLYLGAAPDTFLGSAIQTARYVVESGMIGDVTSCYCAFTRDGDILNRAFPFTAKPGGGIGFDVGIYSDPSKKYRELSKPENRKDRNIRLNALANLSRSNVKTSCLAFCNLNAAQLVISCLIQIPFLCCQRSPAWCCLVLWESCIWPTQINLAEMCGLF